MCKVGESPQIKKGASENVPTTTNIRFFVYTLLLELGIYFFFFSVTVCVLSCPSLQPSRLAVSRWLTRISPAVLSPPNTASSLRGFYLYLCRAAAARRALRPIIAAVGICWWEGPFNEDGSGAWVSGLAHVGLVVVSAIRIGRREKVLALLVITRAQDACRASGSEGLSYLDSCIVAQRGLDEEGLLGSEDVVVGAEARHDAVDRGQASQYCLSAFFDVFAGGIAMGGAAGGIAMGGAAGGIAIAIRPCRRASQVGLMERRHSLYKQGPWGRPPAQRKAPPQKGCSWQK
ncbi:hypothetical protein BU16DRAFT_545211 [Lophium mytilinum]|uniref:Uncharacterized protein n=1 Tax=Lophium mytilinum TaxID=390894 RepID=A0A6A6Q9R3_9PEZI|nr:hypothetical protein BU16DRAFT_545211 [Lophium mytilinum]